MFRELSRKNKELSKDECISILKSEKRGVLSVNGDGGYPYGIPMNHYYNEADGKIYFHCGISGHRNDSLKNNDKVSFCVYDSGYTEKDDWALNINSVIVFGKAEIIDDINIVIDISRKLSLKFTDNMEYIEKEIKAFAQKTVLIVLTPEHVCGKSVKEC